MTAFIWLDEREVLILHDRLLRLHGGASGVWDAGLLKSALAHPQQHAAYADASLLYLGAIYTAGIVKNHPFIDGNKRTGFVLGVMFLELNGYRFSATQEDAVNAVLELAAGQMDKQGYTEFLAANTVSSEEP